MLRHIIAIIFGLGVSIFIISLIGEVQGGLQSSQGMAILVCSFMPLYQIPSRIKALLKMRKASIQK
ncbi:hypothetical protein [Fulvivirga sp.]|uniref:hypothetical protein n=1 Tax=Fulvivirga sp. TaxID=1931237 RepID=UPI0032ED6D3C